MDTRNGWLQNSIRFTVAGALVAASGCSLLYDFSTTQCDKEGESCARKGPQFASAICRNHVCVQQAASGGAPSTGGQGQTGGASEGGNGSGGATTSGGTSTSGGTTSSAGTAGTTTLPVCVNADCMAAHASPYTCIDGKCTQLTDENCPVLIPTKTANDLLKQPSPVILGGFALLNNPSKLEDTLAVINWDMAFDEFNKNALGGGLPAYDGSGKARPLIGLVCQGIVSDSDKFAATMKHLTEELKVPGVLSTLGPDDLYNAYQYTVAEPYLTAGGKPVLFISTNSADSRLADMVDYGMVWHMLGNSRQLAATTVSLLQKMEPVVQQARQALWDSKGQTGPDDPATPLRVTLVYSDYSTMLDLHTVLVTDSAAHPETLLRFNGSAATSAANVDYFRQVQIQSIRSVASGTVPDTMAAQTDLHDNPPHIVVAMTTTEFASNVISYVENGWAQNPNATGRIKPYYLMSHMMAGTSQLLSLMATVSQLSSRVVGVNYAQTQDDHSKNLYNEYLSRLKLFYPSGALYDSLPGWENLYDGAYHLLYSVAAAAVNTKAFDGIAIKNGLVGKVINTSAPSVDIGPANIGDTVSSLNKVAPPFAMSLWATMGPPNFDPTSGTRNSLTSAWCMKFDTTRTPSAWQYQHDGLLYDATNKTFASPTAGVPTCLQSYQ